MKLLIKPLAKTAGTSGQRQNETTDEDSRNQWTKTAGLSLWDGVVFVGWVVFMGWGCLCGMGLSSM